MATVVRTQPLAMQRPRLPFRLSRAVFFALALIITGVALAPFVLTVSGSFKTTSEILDWPPSIIPAALHWENYVEVWTNSRYFPQWIGNSLFLAAFHLLVYLVTCSMAGYAFARLRFPGATVLFLAILGSIMVPGQVLWVPKFLIINQLGLVDNLFGIALPDLAEVFGVFFMTQFFKSLPKELEEAASIDGASTFRTFRQIILPNAYPALAALAILRFQGEWNAFQWPLIVVRSPEHLTLPLGLASFQGLFGVNWNWVLAGAMFNAVPIIILVIFFQKYFIRSAASSAIKG
ncbi:MAG TPA: carbohydrate ABC transporter permease [Candidatus Limnocylindria bacterium]|jgi:multiple sugar transport system permease protein|nr:carbohydrate ABC transporter permease [Candidatus Limnocylindria bacterium]